MAWERILRWAAGLIFVGFGTVRLISGDLQAEMFVRYPDWLRILVSLGEIGGGVALILDFLQRWVALLLGIIMLGAVYTHVMVGLSPKVVPAALLLVAMAYLFSRSPQAGQQA